MRKYICVLCTIVLVIFLAGCQTRFGEGVVINHPWYFELISIEGVEMPDEHNFLIDVTIHGRSETIGTIWQSREELYSSTNIATELNLPIIASLMPGESLTWKFSQINEETFLDNEDSSKFTDTYWINGGWIIDESVFHLVMTHMSERDVEYVGVSIYQEIDGALKAVDEIRFINHFVGE